MNIARAYAPASIGNISCGFDSLGLCLEAPGDTITLIKNNSGQLVITSITGTTTELPTEPEKNCATVALQSLREALGEQACGFDIEIVKGIPGGSGLGSSAASAVAAVVAANELLGSRLPSVELLQHALQGELIASGSVHFDNIAPSLFGGITLIHRDRADAIYALPVPSNLCISIISPGITIRTSEARALLPSQFSLQDMKEQMRDMTAFVHALHTGDFKILSQAIHDRIAEPARKKLIPHFEEVKEVAVKNKSLGFGIAGAGPALFALTNSRASAEELATQMADVYSSFGIPCKTLSGPVCQKGARIIE